MGYGYPTQPYAVPDTYTDASTLYFPECTRLDMILQANAMYYQLQRSQGWGPSLDTGVWYPELYLPVLAGTIMFVSLDRVFTGIRVRNATPGAVAQVVVWCITQAEMPETSGA